MKALLVQFDLRQRPFPAGTEEGAKMLESSAKYFARMPGLLQKTFFISPDGTQYGGFYVFETEQAMQDYLTSEFFTKRVPDVMGVTPTWQSWDVGATLAGGQVTYVAPPRQY